MGDTIIRLWPFDPKRHKGVVFPCLDMPSPPPWFFRLVSHFGLDPSHVVIVKEPSVFRELEFAEPGSNLKSGPKDWYLEYLKSHPVRITNDIPGDKLYFGRTHLIRKGTLMGETYFSELLSANRFVSIRPEEFDIDAQVSMLAKASCVVFLEGSSIYSIELLASTKARVFMIPRRVNGGSLFGPHLEPKVSQFSVLGDPRSIRRMPNRDGNLRPNSPSYTRRPESIVNDMFKHGIISQDHFDLGRFKQAEERDAALYFGGPARDQGSTP